MMVFEILITADAGLRLKNKLYILRLTLFDAVIVPLISHTK